MMADTDVCVPRLLAERCDGAISSPPRWRCVSPEVGRRPDYCFDQSTDVPARYGFGDISILEAVSAIAAETTMPVPLGRSENDPPRRTQAGLQAVGGRDHRRGAFVDGVHDLGVVDSAEVHRGDREVGMSELALNDEQWHPFAGHFDRVSVSQLMWRKPASHTSSRGRVV
jgi:hypothetical protein